MSIILRKMQKSRNRAAEIRGKGKTEKPCRGKALFYLSLLNDELLGVQHMPYGIYRFNKLHSGFPPVMHLLSKCANLYKA